jgi:hypothetical protein
MDGKGKALFDGSSRAGGCGEHAALSHSGYMFHNFEPAASLIMGPRTKSEFGNVLASKWFWSAGRCSGEFGKCVPIKAHPVTGAHRRDRHALLQDQRMLDVSIKPKSVRLQVKPIWTGG